MGIRTGSRRCRRARESSRRGIVAENRTVCRVSGVSSRIASRSSAKPMSSISSASSRTTVATSPEPQAAAVEQVEGPAGRRDDDVDAGLQGAQLPDDRRAAVDRQHAGAEVLAVAVQGLRHLDGELAGRHEDEADRGAFGAVRGQQLEDRQGERRGLAGAGGGLAEQVLAGQQGRDRLPLDGRRLLVAEAGQRAQQLRPETQVVEGGAIAGEVVSARVSFAVHPLHRSPDAPAARRRGRDSLDS